MGRLLCKSMSRDYKTHIYIDRYIASFMDMTERPYAGPYHVTRRLRASSEQGRAERLRTHARTYVLFPLGHVIDSEQVVADQQCLYRTCRSHETARAHTMVKPRCVTHVRTCAAIS